MSKKKIAVLGGGTGTFTVLSGLKHHPVDLTAIVSIADNGGSTGVLRDELGVLPPGDIRQCLVALADGDESLRSLFTYRFHEGGLSGHTFGNLFLSALEKVTGDPLRAVREAHRILNVRGRVIPVSAVASDLFAELEDQTVVVGEHAIDAPDGERAAIARCFLSPSVAANPDALEAIRAADVIVLGPGDLYTSLVPVLLVEGVAQAIADSGAQVVFVLNLATKRGQTDGFTAQRICDALAPYLAPAQLSAVVVNSIAPPPDVYDRYVLAGEQPVLDDLGDGPPRVLRTPLITSVTQDAIKGDALKRSLFRHDPDLLAAAILAVLS